MILCRFAVPVFFMITGFFYPETVARNGNWKQIENFHFTIGANLLYLLWKILLALEDENNIKEALLARFEERVPEDFIFVEFFSAVAAPVVSAGTCLCACNCSRTSGTEKTGLSGTGAVGCLIKGNILFLWEKKTVTFIMRETFCTVDFPFSGWAAGLDPERKLFLAVSTKRKWILLLGFLETWHLWSKDG